MKTYIPLSIIILASALMMIRVNPINATETHQVFYNYLEYTSSDNGEEIIGQFNHTTEPIIQAVYGEPIIFTVNADLDILLIEEQLEMWNPCLNGSTTYTFPAPQPINYTILNMANFGGGQFQIIVRPNLTTFATLYGTRQSDPHWLAQADFNNDGHISLSGLVSLAKLYQQRINWTGPLPNSVNTGQDD